VTDHGYPGANASRDLDRAVHALLAEHGITRRSAIRSALGAGVAVGGSGLLAACGGGDDDGPAQGKPQRGGRLRVGQIGGGASETLDPHAGVNTIDASRAGNLFDRLVRLRPDMTYELELAESFEPNKDASAWTVRLRDGVTFHDGKSLTADDLIYNLKRIGAPKSAFGGASVTNLIHLDRVKKLDERTVIMPLKRPNAELPDFFTIFYMAIVPEGADNPKKPVGTGPFRYVSFKPGQNSLFERNPDYWKPDRPYLSELEIQSIPDEGARLNALLGGQLDCIDFLSFANAKEQKGSGRIDVLESAPTNCVPMTMAVDLDQFKDVRVRQAFRLIADREALLSSAQLGFGDVGNDLIGRGLPFYNTDLPQREQDIDQAKSLLRAAGADNLEITLWSSKAAVGMLESATVFAEQAKQAGVKVNVNNGPADTYYSDKYLKVPFAQTQWPTQPINQFIAQALVPGAIYNETHWDRQSFTDLFVKTIGELDEDERRRGYFDLQEILWNEGGYLIWGFFPFLDGLNKYVRGAVASPAQPLSNYNFRDFWLA
jgi:peptide/nickel transport system substrate-binding protein